MLFVLMPIGAFAFVFGALAAIAQMRGGDKWQTSAFISGAGFALMVSMMAILGQ